MTTSLSANFAPAIFRLRIRLRLMTKATIAATVRIATTAIITVTTAVEEPLASSFLSDSSGKAEKGIQKTPNIDLCGEKSKSTVHQ